MNFVVSKKFNALKNIFQSYENYKGNKKSELEIEINKLKNKISEENYNHLVSSFETYKSYVFNVIANTRRVFIKLTEAEQNINFDDLDGLFDDLEEIKK